MVTDSVDVEMTASVDEEGEVKSPGFPTSCCSSFSATIRIKPGESGFLRLIFTDLDLPRKSKLLVSICVRAMVIPIINHW